MKKSIIGAVVASTVALAASNASALTITAFDGVNPSTLTNALGLSGITLVPGSESYVGAANGSLAGSRAGLYSGFSLSNSSGSTRILGDGVVLASGGLNFSTTTNTVNNWSSNSALSTSNSQLTSLAGGTSTKDSSTLSFSFTAPVGQNAVSIAFVFATDEFPTQSVTDIFGFFVDGVNYAKFPNGDLIQNQSGSSNFTTGYNIEHNGVTQVLTAVGLLDLTKSTHTFSFGIADTSDQIFDSAVFISQFGTGSTSSGTGGVGVVITPPPGGGTVPTPVPVPGTLLLLTAAMAAAGLTRRK